MRIKKRFLGILLSLALVLGLMPGMGLTAYAEGEATPTAAVTLEPTVDNNGKVTSAKILEYAGKQWYVIASGDKGVQLKSAPVNGVNGGTIIVLLAKDKWGSNVVFNSSSNNNYNGSGLMGTMNTLKNSENIGTYYTNEGEKWKNDLIVNRNLQGGAS